MSVVSFWYSAWSRISGTAGQGSIGLDIGSHAFRATRTSIYRKAGGTRENAQAMAAPESPHTTKLDDRNGSEITLVEVDRIAI